MSAGVYTVRASSQQMAAHNGLAVAQHSMIVLSVNAVYAYTVVIFCAAIDGKRVFKHYHSQ